MRPSRSSVSVAMMGVGPVRMRVDPGIVLVRVGMGSDRRDRVVVVMVVVVRMGVIVVQLVVGVLVEVLLGQV